MTPKERAALIARYKDGFKMVSDALKNISAEELDYKISPEKWSCREIVHHLADSETLSAHRLRRLLAEFNPYISGYDQDDYAKRFKYATRPIAPALDAFRAARETTAQIIDMMTEEEWKRTGEHSESGPYSAEKWLQIYAAHAEGHADQIRKNRSKYKERK
jgi:hypothetical protein